MSEMSEGFPRFSMVLIRFQMHRILVFIQTSFVNGSRPRLAVSAMFDHVFIRGLYFYFLVGAEDYLASPFNAGFRACLCQLNQLKERKAVNITVNISERKCLDMFRQDTL